MHKGIYAAASGMITQRERLDVISNNLANISTVGFKKAEPVSRGFYQVFEEQIARFAPERGSPKIPGGGSMLDATTEDFSPGIIMETGNPLDVAIAGSGFFVVDAPAGERYTRAGNFSLDSEGRLVTQNGHPVVGRQGPIVAQGDTVKITPDGDILVDGAATDRLMLVDFSKPYMLSKAGQNLYSATDDARQTISTPGGPLLRVGALERSNVNIVSELMLMIDAARSYETHQRVISAIDEALDATVNEIARS